MLSIASAKLGGLVASSLKKPLIAKRKKIDANKDGKISDEDFKMLRKKQTLMSRRGY